MLYSVLGESYSDYDSFFKTFEHNLKKLIICGFLKGFVNSEVPINRNDQKSLCKDIAAEAD